MKFVSQDELFREADIISLHCPLTSQNENMINNKTIILDKSTIDGAYSIVPSESNNGMNGGKIIIKSGNEILKEIIINYDGCL